MRMKICFKILERLQAVVLVVKKERVYCYIVRKIATLFDWRTYDATFTDILSALCSPK